MKAKFISSIKMLSLSTLLVSVLSLTACDYSTTNLSRQTVPVEETSESPNTNNATNNTNEVPGVTEEDKARKESNTSEDPPQAVNDSTSVLMTHTPTEEEVLELLK